MTDSGLSDAGCPGKWPRPLRLALDSIVTVLMDAYMMARGRAAGSPSKIVRVLAQRDEALWKLRLTERELEAQRRRIAEMASAKRAHFLPADRRELLVLMRLRGWSVKEAARRFVLHRNTLGRWRRKLLNGSDIGDFFGPAPFNKLGDAVRWLVHEMKDMCLDLGHGTRTIANMIVQAGIQLSRSSVQRILREKKPEKPAKAAEKATPESDKPVPRHIPLPRKPNRTWHLDLTVLSIRRTIPAIGRAGCPTPSLRAVVIPLWRSSGRQPWPVILPLPGTRPARRRCCLRDVSISLKIA